MALKIGGSTVINNSREGDFRFVNVGGYTNGQLTGSPPIIIANNYDITFNTTTRQLMVWISGFGWQPIQ